MVPELRAVRLKEIADRVQDQFGGDLRSGLVGSLKDVRKSLKKFPGIADPGADRALLFGGIAPVAAVPSNCPQVLVRIQRGQERENYAAGPIEKFTLRSGSISLEKFGADAASWRDTRYSDKTKHPLT